jgi:hypothetical protein
MAEYFFMKGKQNYKRCRAFLVLGTRGKAPAQVITN